MIVFKKILDQLNVKSFSCMVGIGLSLTVGNAFAALIHVLPNTVISTSTTYSGDTLDMSAGSFIIKNNATLVIKDSVINGTLSKTNPILFNVDTGNLNLDNNTVNVTTVGLPQHPQTQSLEYVVHVALGGIQLTQNNFTIDNPFTAGLLITTASIATTGYQISHNRFENFHGVLYLIASDNALVSDNVFYKNTYGQIVNIGNNSKIIHNTISFSGNNHLGNSIDIIDSDGTTISNNLLLTPTCHGIYILSSKNLMINNNRIHGGITYGMNVLSYPETIKDSDKYIANIVAKYKLRSEISRNITIDHNFMTQNRFGIAASDTEDLTVTNNYFIQRFTDNASRQFWTDNATLLQNVTGLVWTNNLYKEAYSQDNSGNNSQSGNFVVFPQTGGVTL